MFNNKKIRDLKLRVLELEQETYESNNYRGGDTLRYKVLMLEFQTKKLKALLNEVIDHVYSDKGTKS